MTVRVRRPGLVAYDVAVADMVRFTDRRDTATDDEIWLLEHPAVFTLGMNASPAHLLAPGNIPVVRTDRGGQVTYHGPGQLVAYLLLDLERRRLGVRALVSLIEEAVIAVLGRYAIDASARREAPGVYVGGAKIASLGLRVRRGACYHGVALNVAMDLEPFSRINPCGHPGIAVTQVSALGGPAGLSAVSRDLETELLLRLP